MTLSIESAAPNRITTIPATRIRPLYLVKGLSPLAIKKLRIVISEPKIMRNIILFFSYESTAAKRMPECIDMLKGICRAIGVAILIFWD